MKPLIPMYPPDPRPSYALRFVRDCADPTIVIVDAETGERIENGCVAYINSDGKLMRDRGIDPEAAAVLGLKLDDIGRIILAN